MRTPAERVWSAAALISALAAGAFVLLGLLPTTPGTSGIPLAAGIPGAAGISGAAGIPGAAGTLNAPAAASAVSASEFAAALAFGPDVLADVAAYRTPRRAVLLASRSLAFIVPLLLAMLVLRGRGDRALRAVLRLPGVALPVGAVVAVAVVVGAGVRLPLSVWAGVIHDGVWGFRTGTTLGWVRDHALTIGGRALLLGAIATGAVALIRRHPTTWPARVTVLVAVLGPAALLLHPLIVHPLLLPTGPLPEGAHRDAVVAVAARSDVSDVPMLLGEASRRTSRRNAVATGLGPTRRVVLHDTLFDLEPREVAAITAHELAHLERRDPLRGVLAAVPVVLLVGLAVRRSSLLGVGGPHLPSRSEQVRRLAAAALVVLAVEAASAPFAAALSRTIEHRTDVLAVQLSEDAEAYVTMLRAFVIDGLAEPEPPRWSVLLWATHPTPVARIRAVLEVDATLTGSDAPAMR
jgi:STE24 endopeptidase